MKGAPPAEILDALLLAPEPFASHLVSSTTEHQAEADRLISGAAIGWPLERLAVIDRIVLRMAIAELLDPDGPPRAVVIDEAVELAKTYSTEESGRFVNGVLSAVAADIDSRS